MNLQENPKKEAFIIHASSFISPGWVPVPSVWLMLPLNKLLPHLSFHAASLEKMRSWSSLEVTQLSFSLFPCCHSYCGQLKEWTEINILGYQNWAKLMGCSALSFTIKSFSDNEVFFWLLLQWEKAISQGEELGGQTLPEIFSLFPLSTQKNLNVMVAS